MTKTTSGLELLIKLGWAELKRRLVELIVSPYDSPLRLDTKERQEEYLKHDQEQKALPRKDGEKFYGAAAFSAK